MKIKFNSTHAKILRFLAILLSLDDVNKRKAVKAKANLNQTRAKIDE